MSLLLRGAGKSISAGGGIWTPASITADAWLDVSDLATMFQEITGASATTPASVGNVVGSMLNKGSQGGWAVANATSKRPILRQTGGGKYYLEGDATDDFLELPLVAASGNAIHVAAAMQPRSVTNFERFMSLARAGAADYNTTTTFSGIIRNSSTTTWGSFYNGAMRGSRTLTINTDVVMETIQSGTTNVASGDGSDSSSSTVASATWNITAMRILGAFDDSGAEGARSGAYFYGGVVKFGTLSGGDRASLLTYLGALQGRTL